MLWRSGDRHFDAKEARFADELCDRFEKAWEEALSKKQPTPEIEDYLKECSKTLRPALFSELLALELDISRKAGRDVKWGDYRQRFPDHADELARLSDVEDPALAPTENFGESSTVSIDLENLPDTVDEFPANSETSPSSEAEKCPPLERIGRYKILDVLGEGSFGCVYLAEDEKLRRKVAIKVPHPQNGSSSPNESSAWLAQFEAEASKVAGLEYEGIVPVYDIGRMDDGRPFIVSRYIAGKDLAYRLENGHLDSRETAEIVEQVARALHKAHVCELIHRDIKPHNILLDEEDRPFVADFGLALSTKDRRKHRGHVAGSPAYMSPEQVRGEMHHIDGRADIWSLGVMLYEMLAGERPFSGSNATELFEAIQEDHVRPLRQINDSIPVELERITLKCLAKNPIDRYPTAKDLAQDLRRWRGVGFSSRTKILSASAAALVMAVPAWFFFFPNPTPSAVPEPLEGTLSIKKFVQTEGSEEPLVFTDSDSPSLFRVEGGEMIRFGAKLNRPAHLYLLWIDSEGQVLPLHPWVLKWDDPPITDELQSEVISPSHSTGWDFGGPPGVETLVLLGRDEPLPADFDLQKVLPEFSIIELPPALRRRGPQSTIPRDIPTVDDSERRGRLEEKLKPYFPLVEIKSFINLGDPSSED